VIEPLRQQIARAGSSTAFFMQPRAPRRNPPATGDPQLLVDYTGVSPQALQALARNICCLTRPCAWR
jgi:zinc protease